MLLSSEPTIGLPTPGKYSPINRLLAREIESVRDEEEEETSYLVSKGMGNEANFIARLIQEHELL